MLTKNYFIIRGFSCIHLTSRYIGCGPCGGVSVLVRDDIPCSECKLSTALQAKAVIISTKTITVCSLYLPPSDNLNSVLLTRLIANMCPGYTVEQLLSLLGIWFGESVANVKKILFHI